MHFSPTFRSSPQRAASPDGRMVASLTSDSIVIRSTDTLQTLNAVALPSELSASGPILTLLWSPSSAKILLSTAQQIHVLSALDSTFHAVVRNPVSSNARPAHIAFGHDDNEVLVFSSFGLKLLIFDLTTSKAVEISSPKFHHPSTAAQSFSIRSDTGHIALLTRVGGRDTVSIHAPGSRQLKRSWYPDTIDAQAICWSPDSQWLLVWESPAHGWRLLLYTLDGQVARKMNRLNGQSVEDAELAPGIRSCHFSPSEELLAVGDHSRKIVLLNTATWRETLLLVHPSIVCPSETLQIWQEQLHASLLTQQRPPRSFLRATQEITPPGPLSDYKVSLENKTGCSLASFDASSSLLASRLDDSPGTVWIWDVTAAELRAVLIFHASVEFHWHRSIRELLLITSLDRTQSSTPFIWDPVSDGPKGFSLEAVRGEKEKDTVSAAWVDWGKENAALLLSTPTQYCLASTSDAGNMPEHWADHQRSSLGGSMTADDGLVRDDATTLHNGGDDTSMLDDTFSFKHG